MEKELERIDMETKLTANPALVLREEEDDNAILFDPDSGSVRIMNSTAAAIYRLLDGSRTVSDVKESLKQEFEQCDDAAEAQILDLLKELRRIGIVGTVTEFSK